MFKKSIIDGTFCDKQNQVKTVLFIVMLRRTHFLSRALFRVTFFFSKMTLYCTFYFIYLFNIICMAIKAWQSLSTQAVLNQCLDTTNNHFLKLGIEMHPFFHLFFKCYYWSYCEQLVHACFIFPFFSDLVIFNQNVITQSSSEMTDSSLMISPIILSA